jgi:hypothetical protein
MQEELTNLEPGETVTQVALDPVKVREFQEQLARQENLPAGIAAGLAAAVIGGIAWAVFTVATQYQIGWMAVAVGLLVGISVRKFGRGISTPFAVAGCLLALLGCLLGNLLSACGFLAVQESLPMFHVLSRLNPELVAALMSATFSPMHLLFYGIALYAGYSYSARRITAEELQSLMKANS